MRISQINTAANSRANKQITQNNKENNKNQSFGLIGDGVALATANAIENGGLFVSFTLQDMIGTNIPRPIMGLMRNTKENNGEKNVKFAAKELVREMLTGPSMFIIPGAMLAAGKPILGKSINTPMEQIKALGEIHAQNPLNAFGETISKKEFYQNTFAEMIKNAKHESVASEGTLSKAKEFAQKLVEKAGDKKALRTTLTDLADDFTIIAKQHATNPAHTDFTVATIKSSTTSFKDGVSNMMAYADDMIGKVNGFDKANISNKIRQIVNNKTLVRLGTNAAMFASVIAFLRVIPKLYNKAEGDKNAGLVGLMKEETLNDASINQNANKNKSTPSFGSASSVTAKVADALTSKGIVGKIAKGIEFEGMNVSFPLLMATMGLGVLLPRLQQAKDKYDREEILRRDVVTCATMCFAEKALRKGFSKVSEATSGLVVASKPANFNKKSALGKFFEYIRPINGVNTLSTPQIISKYSGIDKYKDGITGFCDFIIGQKGNLSKVFSLTPESQALVQNVLGDGVNLASADNKTIRTALDKAKESENVKKLVDLFKDKDNPWVTKAKTMNARFTAFSVLVLVPVFLGFMLPAINERLTKKRIKEEQALKDAENKNNQNKQPQIQPQMQRELKASNIFAEMSKYTS